MICRDCALQDHRDHSFFYLNEAGKKIREHALEIIEEVKVRINTLEESVHSVKERAQLVLDKCDTTASTIHEFMIELRREVQQRIDNRERALLTELKQIGQTKLKSLQAQKTELEAHLKDMKSRFHAAESSLQTISDSDLFKSKDATLEELDDLLHLHVKHTEPLDEEIFFVADPTDIHTAISDVGRVGGAEDDTGVGVIQSDNAPVAEYCSLSLKKKTLDKQIVCFVVTMRNQYRNLITKGEDSLVVEITGPKEKVIVHDIINNNDGTYLISFAPGDVGKYEISVMIEDEDVDKSPFVLLSFP